MISHRRSSRYQPSYIGREYRHASGRLPIAWLTADSDGTQSVFCGTPACPTLGSNKQLHSSSCFCRIHSLPALAPSIRTTAIATTKRCRRSFKKVWGRRKPSRCLHVGKVISNVDTLTASSEGEAGLEGPNGAYGGDQDPNNLRGERVCRGSMYRGISWSAMSWIFLLEEGASG